MEKAARNALLGAGIAAGVAGGAWVLTKSLVSFALDREPPKSVKKASTWLSGPRKANDPLLARTEAAARKLENSSCTTVGIVSRDGIRLVGHWYEHPNPKRVVVAMHGWRSSWSKDFGMIADFLHNNGCSVLYAEQRGQNCSGGKYMTFGLWERHDCLDWVRWVNENTQAELPIYLAGISMGATTVLMATGLNLPPNVCGVVADCGFTSAHDIWKHVTEEALHLRYGLHSKLVDKFCRQKIGMSPNGYSTVDAMRGCRVPVLFIHGTADRFVPVTMTYENYRVCTAPKQLLIVPGARHGMSYCVEQDRYEKAVKEFWNAYPLGR